MAENIDNYLLSKYLTCNLQYQLIRSGNKPDNSGSKALMAGICFHKWAEHCILSGMQNVEQLHLLPACTVNPDWGAPYVLIKKDDWARFEQGIVALKEWITDQFGDNIISIQTEHCVAFEGWAAKCDCVIVVKTIAGDKTFILEWKTSKTALNANSIENYLRSDNQICGQLFVGKGNYSNFSGVFLLHYNFTDQQITPIFIPPDEDRLFKFATNWSVWRECLTNNLEHINPYGCTQFFQHCDFYDFCWNNGSLDDFDKDTWVAGEGWVSEKE